MRCGSTAAVALVVLAAAAAAAASGPVPAASTPQPQSLLTSLPFFPAPVRIEERTDLTRVHGQRYSMGTMFDIVVFHAWRGDAERAIEAALDEVVRLDAVMSHFRPDSGLSRLMREGRGRFTTVDPDLYKVLEHATAVSALTEGRFDVTVAPLLAVWKRARDERRTPAAAELDAARRCVGFSRIEASPPDRIRLNSDCVALDLGGIGKGYAVDRALDVLVRAGIRRGVVNAGGSSIGAIGAPPGADGWAVRLGEAEGPALLLRDHSMSTSHYEPSEPARGGPSDIIDARSGTPAGRLALTIVSRDATTADALSTALTMMTIDEGRSVLRRTPGVSALWLADDGRIAASYGELTPLPAGAH